MKHFFNYNTDQNKFKWPLKQYFEKNNIQLYYKIECKNITLLLSNKFIFKNINLTISNGSLILLQGLNGSGKSSLLRILTGFIQPTFGYISYVTNNFKNVKSNLDKKNSELHYINHIDPIKTSVSILKNLIFWLEIYKLKYIKYLTILKVLQFLKINKLKFMNGNILSMGQRRRLSLSRLFTISNPIWLLDEPTAALDINFLKTFSKTIQEHRNSGGLAIISTHMNLHIEQATSLRL
uniref:Cytochrome C biogenesis protein CcmA n=1 Tax=Palpitomonas bilix TaxID=652834 RepID=A0A1E1GHS9_9EUKA|nr:cytochrome C biogenesis protein CcmA [Palpitomonas bilix]YP_009317254.1 cytochrome C biogenesis protein CcmA [Palpitomonas bilix]BAV82399.1 cytochrome C biogenesis protein CcmA [Palpitomonas bilix]BAV82422.1 cytochrome C biogenesis protein CcmA [Palpitomonas bilix]